MPDAIQSRIPNNQCFGCGPLNGAGLKIKSYQVGEETTPKGALAARICALRVAGLARGGPDDG